MTRGPSWSTIRNQTSRETENILWQAWRKRHIRKQNKLSARNMVLRKKNTACGKPQADLIQVVVRRHGYCWYTAATSLLNQSNEPINYSNKHFSHLVHCWLADQHLDNRSNDRSPYQVIQATGVFREQDHSANRSDIRNFENRE